MKNKLTVVLALVLVLALTACGTNAGDATTQAAGSTASIQPDDGISSDYHETLFLSFSLVEVRRVDSYAGLTPAEGNMLIDAVIETTNIYTMDIQMVDFDYQVQWGDPEDETTYTFPLDAADETMAPGENTLSPGESMEYHYIFEIPQDADRLQIAYGEMWVTPEGEEGYGSVYFIPFTV